MIDDQLRGSVERTCYYFGCVEQAGHYMHTPNLHSDHKFMRANPWGFHVDNGLCPKNGAIGIHHKDGWTAIAFIDNSVDTRPGSNSAFLVKGEYDMATMVEIANQEFPSISKRVMLQSRYDAQTKG